MYIIVDMQELDTMFNDGDLAEIAAEARRFDSLNSSISRIMNSKDSRNNKIYQLRNIGMKLQAIGEKFGGMSRERVRQIYNECKERVENDEDLNLAKKRKPRLTENEKFLKDLKMTTRAMDLLCWLSDNIEPNDEGEKMFCWSHIDTHGNQASQAVTDVVLKGLLTRKLIFIVDSPQKTYHRDNNAKFTLTQDGEAAASLRDFHYGES